jgi:hypothetical protein
MDEAQGKESQDEYLVRRIFAMNFASIHTTSMVRSSMPHILSLLTHLLSLRQTFTHSLFYLASNPEYWSALREEVEDVTNREGWTKSAVDHMFKIDSFVKESQRLHPLGAGKFLCNLIRIPIPH